MILVYDFETTGLPEYKIPSDDPAQPHIVEVGALVINDSLDVVKSWSRIVKPDGWQIPVDISTNIHGITTEMALQHGISEKVAIQEFMDLVDECSLRVAHYDVFDSRIARIAMKRYGFLPYAEDFWRPMERYCTCNNFRRLNKSLKLGGQDAKLGTAYRVATGEEMDDRVAHTALGDAEACLEVYRFLRSQEKVLDTQGSLPI